jgi:hypothetical protein
MLLRAKRAALFLVLPLATPLCAQQAVHSPVDAPKATAAAEAPNSDTSHTLAQEAKPSVDIRTEYLMTIEAKLGSRVAVGQRVIVDVLGGTVRGPRLKGSIVTPAGDWVLVMPDGSSRLDVRFTIKTDENEFVFVEYSGISVPTKEAQERLAKGEAVTDADGYGYFIITPRFMTTSAKYAWLNEIQAVGKMVSVQRGVAIKYDVFAVR